MAPTEGLPVSEIATTETPTAPQSVIAQSEPEPAEQTPVGVAPDSTEHRETGVAPEKLNTTQSHEIDVVANNALVRGIDSATEKIEGLSEDERKKALEQNPGENALIGIATLRTLPSGKYNSDENNPESVSFTKGTRVAIRGERILCILEATKGEFRCKVELGDGTKPERTFTRAEVINAQIISEKEAILSQFEGATRDVMEMEIKALDGEDPMEGKTPDQVDQVIREAAKASGMLTADDVRALAAKLGSEGDALTNVVKDKNIVDADTAVAICGAVGYDPGSAESQRSAVTQNRLDTQEQLKRKDLTPEARQKTQEQLNALRTKEIMLRKVAEVFKGNGPIKQFFKMMEEGRVDMDTAKSMIANFRNGNFESLAETAFTNSDLELDKNLSPEEMEIQRRERIDLLKKSSKLAGLGLMFLLFSLVTSAIESGKR